MTGRSEPSAARRDDTPPTGALQPPAAADRVVGRPGRWIWLLACTVGLVVGGLYWAVSVLSAPDDPVLLRLLYRYDGDSDYLPLTFALARGQLSEFIHFEGAAAPLPFPWVSQLVHVALVWTMGPWGFALADAVVCAALFALWLAIARRVVPVGRTAQLLVASLLFFLAGPLRPGTERMLGQNLPFWAASSPYWEFRYPRPFVTGALALAVVLALTHAYEAQPPTMRSARRFCLAGVLLGLLLQGDLHGAVALSLLAGGLILFRALRRHEIRSIPLLAGAFALGVLPTAAAFLIQASSTNTELRRRWGEFVVSRRSPIVYLPPAMLISGLLLALILVRVGESRARRRAEPRGDLAFALIALCAAASAAVALPLFSVLTARQIQQYHFLLRAEAFLRLTWLLTAIIGIRHLALVSGFADTVGRELSAVARRRLQLAALVLVWVGGGGELLRLAVHAARSEAQPAIKLAEGWPASPGYRRDLAGVLRELSSREYRSFAVLGTFDQLLSMAWLTTAGRSLYVPDVFLSTAGDEVILGRTAALAKCLGASPAWFAERLGEQYFQTRFISLDRWQASAAYTAAPLADYTRPQLASIARSRAIDSWHVEVPRSEVARQSSVFESARPCAPGRLDVVVNANVGPFAELSGRVPGFVKRFENSTFTVWTRPPSVGAASQP